MNEISKSLQEKRAQLKDVFDSADENGKYTHEQKEAINQLNTELADLTDEAKLESTKAKNEKAMETSAYAPEEDESVATIGESFINTDAYK